MVGVLSRLLSTNVELQRNDRDRSSAFFSGTRRSCRVAACPALNLSNLSCKVEFSVREWAVDLSFGS